MRYMQIEKAKVRNFITDTILQTKGIKESDLLKSVGDFTFKHDIAVDVPSILDEIIDTKDIFVISYMLPPYEIQSMYLPKGTKILNG